MILHFWLSSYFTKLKSKIAPGFRAASINGIPQREPRLSITLSGDYQEYAREEEKRLKTFGWEDRAKGRVRIPIEQAMERMLHER